MAHSWSVSKRIGGITDSRLIGQFRRHYVGHRLSFRHGAHRHHALWLLGHGKEEDALTPIASLRAPLLQIRQLSAGDSIGYGATFTASGEMTIGIASLGYGDGLSRHFGNQSPSPIRFTIGAQPVSLLGRISMDSLAIDLTNLAELPAIGDMVEIFGDDNPIDRLAQQGNTISMGFSHRSAAAITAYTNNSGDDVNFLATMARFFSPFVQTGRLSVCWSNIGGHAAPADLRPHHRTTNYSHRIFLFAGRRPDLFLHRRCAGHSDLLWRQSVQFRSHCIQHCCFGHHPRIGAGAGWLDGRRSVSAAIAAEIGTMLVTEQIDALTTLSTNPHKYLVAPRVIAATLCMPILALIADIIGIFGGFVVGTQSFGFNAAIYVQRTINFLTVDDVTSGLIKATVFGFIIAMMGCYNSYYSKGGAQGVGRATTNTVVSASILILAANYLMTSLLFSSALQKSPAEFTSFSPKDVLRGVNLEVRRVNRLS